MEHKKLWVIGTIFVASAFISLCMFPIVNLTKEDPITASISWFILIYSLFFLIYIGYFESKVLFQHSIVFIILFNSCATLMGMGSRFLLEWGEVSNVYNFTLPNMAFHMLVSLTIISISWWFFRKRLIKNQSK